MPKQTDTLIVGEDWVEGVTTAHTGFFSENVGANPFLYRYEAAQPTDDVGHIVPNHGTREERSYFDVVSNQSVWFRGRGKGTTTIIITTDTD